MILDLFNESAIFDMDDSAVNESLEPEIENAEATPIKEGESITDAYFRITLENVQNYNNIINTVAVAEMAYMEKTGATSPMYEAVDVKQFGQTIVKFVQKAWSKIKGLFESAITAVAGIFGGDAEKRYLAAVKAGKIDPSLMVTVKKGVKAKDLVNIPNRVNTVISSAMKDLMVNASDISGEDAKSKASDWKENKTTKINEMRGKVIGAFGGETAACTSKDFATKLGNAISTKIEGETKIKIGDAYYHLKNDVTAKDLRKGFKDTQKSFNECMKEAKSIEKTAKSEKAEAAMTAAAMNVNIIKESIAVLNATSHQFIKLASKQASMYKAVVNSGLKKAGSKKDDKKTTNESADLICDLI